MHPDDQIRVGIFPKTSETEYLRIFSSLYPIEIRAEEGAGREHAILEAVMSGERGGTTRVRLHPGVQFVVKEGKVEIKTHPKELYEIFKCMLEKFQVAWVTEKTFLEYMDQFKNPYFRLGTKLTF